MITEKQLKIFQVFAKQPFAEFTRKQIKQLADERSNNSLALAIKQFDKEGVIKMKRIGKSSLISLNLDKDTVYYYIALANTQRIGNAVRRTLNIVTEEIEKVTSFYSLVIFGSYAVKEQKTKSDMDLAIFIETAEKRKNLQAALNSAVQKSLIPLDAHVITKDEFLEMLTNDEENLGKQIARKHLVVFNHQIFYELIKKGIKHGFNL